MVDDDIAGAKRVAVLESRLIDMADDIKLMRHSMDSVAEKLNRIAVIEERHAVHAEGLKGAFARIAALDAKIEPMQRWLYGAWGAGMALAAIWTMFGFYVQDSLKHANDLVAVAQSRQQEPR